MTPSDSRRKIRLLGSMRGIGRRATSWSKNCRALSRSISWKKRILRIRSRSTKKNNMISRFLGHPSRRKSKNWINFTINLVLISQKERSWSTGQRNYQPSSVRQKTKTARPWKNYSHISKITFKHSSQNYCTLWTMLQSFRNRYWRAKRIFSMTSRRSSKRKRRPRMRWWRPMKNCLRFWRKRRSIAS